MSKNYNIESFDGEIIKCTVYGTENKPDSPCVILTHGFKGFKDWGFFPYSAEYFANRGFFVISFNFSLNGIGDDPLEFSEIDNFARNTISREVEELSVIVNAYKSGRFGEHSDGKIGLVGHSRGGGVCILNSAYNTEVDVVVTWASVSDFMRYSQRQQKEWKNTGVLEVKNARTGQIMRMNYSYLEDILTNQDGKLNVLKAAKMLQKPLLVIHGEQDLSVKPDEGRQISAAYQSDQLETVFIEAAGHTFDIVHPFAGSNEKFDLVLESTDKFLKKYLK